MRPKDETVPPETEPSERHEPKVRTAADEATALTDVEDDGRALPSSPNVLDEPFDEEEPLDD